MAATIASSHEGLEIYCIRYGRVPLTFGFDFRAAFFTGLGLLAIASSSDGWEHLRHATAARLPVSPLGVRCFDERPSRSHVHYEHLSRDAIASHINEPGSGKRPTRAED